MKLISKFALLGIYVAFSNAPSFAQSEIKLPTSIYKRSIEVTASHEQSAKIYYTRGEPLTPATQDIVNHLLSNIKSSNGTLQHVYLTGHSDTSGSSAENLRVSTDYARMAARLFQNSGISNSKISTSGVGDTSLYKETKRNVREPLNRRVEIRAVYTAPAKFEDGKTAFDAGDFERATSIWKPLAEAGDTDAQVFLGARYFEGRGVPQSNSQALHWIRKSAEAGNLEAMRTLNIFHTMEPSLKISYEESTKWYLERAKHGDVLAQTRMADRFYEKEDFENAKYWYEKAAAQGDEDSLKRLKTIDAVDDFNKLLDATVSKSRTLLGREKFPVFADTDMSETGDVAASCSMVLIKDKTSDGLPDGFELLPDFYLNPRHNGGFSDKQSEPHVIRHTMTSQFSPENGPTADYCKKNVWAFIEKRVAEK